MAMNVYAQNRQQLVALGDSCMREYDFFHAIQHYQQAQQIRTENKVRLKLAECFYQRNDYHGCSDVLDKVPSDSLNHNALRQLYYSNSAMKNTSEQLYWGTYIKIRYPMDSKIIADVMGLLVSDSYDKPEVAVSYGQDYCLIDSTNIEVNRALGEAYFLNKDYERCVATYRRLFAEKDTTYNSLYYMGGAFEYLNQLDSAAFYFTRAVERAPKMAVGNYRLGVVENQLGHYENALKYLHNAATLYEPSKFIMFIIYKNMGDAKFNLKDIKAADLYWGYALAYRDDPELAKRRQALK